MNLLVKTASEEEVAELKHAFQQIDEDGTGLIKASELQDILLKRRMNVSGAEVQDIIG